MARRNARDVVVRFLSDVNGFLRGTDDVAAAFRDVARESDRTADAGERDARELARAYERAADKMTRDARDAGRKQRAAFGDAGREAGDEFAQNVGESVASGDISGMLSGTVGGLVGTFGKGGPIGLALGALAGVGVGVFQAIQAQAEQAAAAAQLAFDELHESTTREARLNAVLTDRFGSTLAGWEAIQRYADGSGISADKIADALIDGGPKARQMADSFDRIMRAAYETEGEVSKAQAILIDGADDLRDRADAMERAAKAAQTERDALKESSRYLSARSSTYRDDASNYGGLPPYATGRR